MVNNMRSSQDTERTQIATRSNSMDDLAAKHNQLETLHSSVPQRLNPGFDNDKEYRDGSRRSSDAESYSAHKDLESGNASADQAKEKQEQQEQKDPNIVDWDGDDDPEKPMNWSKSRKWIITIVLGLVTLCITFASSVFSTATVEVAKQFDVSTEVTTLGTSLFVLGFAVGPLVFGPMSELFGRKKPLFFGYFVFAIFSIATAVSQTLYSIMITRFFGGVFGSAPLAIIGGMLADFWGPVDRGVAVCVFAASVFTGPVLGPIVGGFITQSSLGWRWTEYLVAIMAFTFGTIGFLVVPETSASVLLSQRAKHLKYQTKNWALRAKSDEQEVDFHNILHVYLLRPFEMIVKEPILLLITLYLALIYGILYLFFEAYPISFQIQRSWNQGVGALPFLGIMIGVLMGAITISIITKTRFARKLKKHGKVIPEERLPPMIIGAFVLPIGLFWFAWTSSPHITWVPQVIAGAPIGMGIIMIFLQGLNYIIDVYMMHANSAIAANTFLRSLAGAGFPLFATYMYNKLGVAWATSLLAFLCVALIPVPILFFIYGKKLRSLSKFSPY